MTETEHHDSRAYIADRRRKKKESSRPRSAALVKPYQAGLIVLALAQGPVEKSFFTHETCTVSDTGS